MASDFDELPALIVKRGQQRDQKPHLKSKRKKSMRGKTPMRNSKSRKDILHFVTHATAESRPRQRYQPKQLTPLKHKPSPSKDDEMSKSQLMLKNKLWIPSGHSNSMGRNKLASLGKAIFVDY